MGSTEVQTTTYPHPARVLMLKNIHQCLLGTLEAGFYAMLWTLVVVLGVGAEVRAGDAGPANFPDGIKFRDGWFMPFGASKEQFIGRYSQGPYSLCVAMHCTVPKRLLIPPFDGELGSLVMDGFDRLEEVELTISKEDESNAKEILLSRLGQPNRKSAPSSVLQQWDWGTDEQGVRLLIWKHSDLRFYFWKRAARPLSPLDR